jgi:hypothetical protein
MSPARWGSPLDSVDPGLRLITCGRAKISRGRIEIHAHVVFKARSSFRFGCHRALFGLSQPAPTQHLTAQLHSMQPSMSAKCGTRADEVVGGDPVSHVRKNEAWLPRASHELQGYNYAKRTSRGASVTIRAPGIPTGRSSIPRASPSAAKTKRRGAQAPRGCLVNDSVTRFYASRSTELRFALLRIAEFVPESRATA